MPVTLALERQETGGPWSLLAIECETRFREQHLSPKIMSRTVTEDACYWLLTSTQACTQLYTHEHSTTQIDASLKGKGGTDVITVTIRPHKFPDMNMYNMAKFWHRLVHPGLDMALKWDTVILPCFCGNRLREINTLLRVTQLASG